MSFSAFGGQARGFNGVRINATSCAILMQVNSRVKVGHTTTVYYKLPDEANGNCSFH